MAWVLLVGLLAGLFAFVGASGAAGADPSPPDASCGTEAEGTTLALPSGDTETFCYGEADGGAATNALPAIELTKTVGTNPNTCASTDQLQVVSGTQVFYCYSVVNTGSVTVSVHDLDDDKLGSLLDGFNYDLGPGSSTFMTASATIADDTVNVATWTASDGVDSAQSVDTATVTVSSAPSAPQNPAATVAEGQAGVVWNAPADDGGSAVTGYVVTPYVGAVAGTPTVVATPTTSATIDGLTNGTTYTFKVAATNAVGTGPESVASNAVTPQWWLPWSSGPVAVTELFTWMTGKAPTSAESSSWLAQLNGGTKLPGDLVAALRVGADATANVDPTVRLYSAYLTRIPDASGLNFWLGRRRAGWTLSRISANFANSNEFKTRYGTLTNQQFVEQIYLNVLGRPGESSGVTYWTNQLDTGKKSRGQVMINFSESNEYKNKQVNKTHAAVVYIHVAGKAPTLTQRDDFVAELVGGTPLADLVRDIIHSPGFDARAG